MASWIDHIDEYALTNPSEASIDTIEDEDVEASATLEAWALEDFTDILPRDCYGAGSEEGLVAAAQSQ